MNILVACEESQAVTIELRKLGHNAFSCDLVECSGSHPEWHIIEDCTQIMNGKCNFITQDGEKHEQSTRWDMIIAFPPCTHLAVSGAAWFEKKRKDGRQELAIRLFGSILNADCDKIAVENPVGIIGGEYIEKWFPHLCELYGFPRTPSQKIHPWNFGDAVNKTTCLWLKNLPLLELECTEMPDIKYANFIDKNGKKTRQEEWYYKTRCLPHSERGKIASKTFPGIARAMAQQWTK